MERYEIKTKGSNNASGIAMMDGKMLYSLFEESQSARLDAWEHLKQSERSAWEETARRVLEYFDED